MDINLLNCTYTQLSNFEKSRLGADSRLNRTTSSFHCTRATMKTGTFLVNFAKNEDKARYYTKNPGIKRYHNYPYALGTPVPIERLNKSTTLPKLRRKKQPINDANREVRDFLNNSQKIPDALKKEMFLKSLSNPKLRSVKLVSHCPKHKDNNYIKK